VLVTNLNYTTKNFDLFQYCKQYWYSIITLSDQLKFINTDTVKTANNVVSRFHDNDWISVLFSNVSRL